MLLDVVSGEADWSAYRDETAAELRALVEAKLQGQPVAPEARAVVLPLLQALQASLAATGQPAATGPAEELAAGVLDAHLRGRRRGRPRRRKWESRVG
jgi:non-homologous end joining protein Ku